LSFLCIVDEMGSRIDELESSIRGMLESQGVEDAEKLIQSIRAECGITEEDLQPTSMEDMIQLTSRSFDTPSNLT
jgi:hypothetical protein